MYNFGNAKTSQLGLKEKTNKYSIDKNHIDLNAQNDSHSIIAREILKNKNIKLNVLDVGCGSGTIGKFLEVENIILDGVEIDKEAIEEAKKNHYHKLYNTDINEISKSIKQKYDYIILADILEHLVKPYKILEELALLLKENGSILISIPNIEHMDIIANLIDGKFNYNEIGTLDTTHLRFFTYYSFLEMIDNINKDRENKLEVECIGSTKTFNKEYIDYNSELYSLLNLDGRKDILQNIFKIKILNKNVVPTNLKKELANKQELNIYHTLEKEVENTKKYYDLLSQLEANNSELTNEILELTKKNSSLNNLYLGMVGSRTWKIMEPVRKGVRFVKRVNNKLRRVRNKLSVAIDNSDVKTTNYDIEKNRLDIEEMILLVKDYDLISFDIFDTLIFRPFLEPTDLFNLMELEYYLPGFAERRVEAEEEARGKTSKKNYEINIYDIYEELSNYLKIDKDDILEKEFAFETKCCYANPYFLEIFHKLQEMGKKVIVTSDMYWPKEYIQKLLQTCGYEPDEIYVSCDYEANKGTGAIQKIINDKYPNKKIIHIGDNYLSDIKGSQKAGWDTYYYKKCSEIAKSYKEPVYSNSLINSITCAVRINYLYSGFNKYTGYFKYGFIYGGILTIGFLENINKQVKQDGIDKILFLARDSKVLYEAYKKYYNQYPSEYLITSRSAMFEISFASQIEEFINFYFKSRALMGKYTIEEALYETDLDILISKVSQYDLNLYDFLNMNNFDKLKNMIYQEAHSISEYFSSSKKAAIKYFDSLTEDTSKALAVDLGWSGSIVNLMRPIFQSELKNKVELYGTFVGNKDSKKVNALVDTKIFRPYCFSYENSKYYLDIGTLEDSSKAMIMEAMFTSTDKTLLKYADTFVYGNATNNDYILKEVHKGILEFVKLYKNLNVPMIDKLDISSEVAFRPLFEALKRPEYSYAIFSNFKEYNDSLPRFKSNREMTTLGKIMKDRNII